MSFWWWNCVWKFQPNISLVVLLNENLLHNSKLLSIIQNLFLQRIEKRWWCTFHLEHVCHHHEWVRHCWNWRSLQIWIRRGVSGQTVHQGHFASVRMKVIVASACISLCIHGHCWNWNWITFYNLKPIHFFDSSLSIFNVFILYECKTFALTCFWISVNINIINFTKRLEKLFQLTFWHLSEFALQTSHLYFGKSSFLFSLLFIRIDLFGYFHLSKFK